MTLSISSVALVPNHLRNRIVYFDRFPLVLDHRERKSVHKENNIRTTIVPFGQFEFRAHMERVIGRFGKIDELHLRCALAHLCNLLARDIGVAEVDQFQQSRNLARRPGTTPPSSAASAGWSHLPAIRFVSIAVITSFSFGLLSAIISVMATRALSAIRLAPSLS